MLRYGRLVMVWYLVDYNIGFSEFDLLVGINIEISFGIELFKDDVIIKFCDE